MKYLFFLYLFFQKKDSCNTDTHEASQDKIIVQVRWSIWLHAQALETLILRTLQLISCSVSYESESVASKQCDEYREGDQESDAGQG